MTKKSPLAPARFPNLLPVAGVRLGATAAGIRYEGRDDVMLAEFPEVRRSAACLPSRKPRRHLSSGVSPPLKTAVLGAWLLIRAIRWRLRVAKVEKL